MDSDRESRESKLKLLEKVIRKHCQRLAKDPTENHQIWHMSETLMRAFEKPVEGFGLNAQKEEIRALEKDLRSIKAAIGKLSVANRDFLERSIPVLDSDPRKKISSFSIENPNLSQSERLNLRLDNMSSLLIGIQSLQRKSSGMAPPISQTNYRQAIIAGMCRKIWHYEKESQKPMTLHKARTGNKFYKFIEAVFHVFNINGNPGAALDSYNNLTSYEDGVSL